jgi:hypothetical protein
MIVEFKHAPSPRLPTRRTGCSSKRNDNIGIDVRNRRPFKSHGLDRPVNLRRGSGDHWPGEERAVHRPTRGILYGSHGSRQKSRRSHPPVWVICVGTEPHNFKLPRCLQAPWFFLPTPNGGGSGILGDNLDSVALIFTQEVRRLRLPGLGNRNIMRAGIEWFIANLAPKPDRVHFIDVLRGCRSVDAQNVIATQKQIIIAVCIPVVQPVMPSKILEIGCQYSDHNWPSLHH